MINYVIKRDSDGKYWADGGEWVKNREDAYMFGSSRFADEGETAIPVEFVPKSQPTEQKPNLETAARQFWERTFMEALGSRTVEVAVRTADLCLEEWRKKEWKA